MRREDSPDLDHLASIHLDGSRKHPMPADVHGRFINARRVTFFALIAFYLALPFIQIGGHPAMQFDIAARRFYLFGSVFNAQDGFRLVFFALSGAFTLIFVTALVGRVWCGWACPQTVFLEAVYRPIERLLEGPRELRIRRNEGPLTFDTVWRKAVKHLLYIAVSLALGHVFLALFVSLPSMFEMMRADPRKNWTPFVWVMGISSVLYFNWAWFREQFCVVLCPYGRLQSVLMDEHSLVIGYDRARGEPRGRITREEKISLPVVSAPRGDCVDCHRCVAVCPTGIDIRQGTQMECLACAQCIDACDDVMGRLGKPKGLIRYASLKGFAGEATRWLRPRTALYGVILTIGLTGLTFATVGRSHFEANLLRVKGAPYVVDDTTIRNVLELHVVNKNAQASKIRLELDAPASVQWTVPAQEVSLEPLQDYRMPIVLTVARTDWKGPVEFTVRVHDSASGQGREIPSKVLGPR